jgi:tetratricopeptide (TPR) repeat protein
VVAASGGTDRPDAPTLTARAAALLTLGRPAEAIPYLREALRLTPDYAAAKAGLRTAEGALAARRRSSSPTRATLPAASLEAAAHSDAAFSNEAPVTRSN